jgi:single-stranded DNA-binding protein
MAGTPRQISFKEVSMPSHVTLDGYIVDTPTNKKNAITVRVACRNGKGSVFIDVDFLGKMKDTVAAMNLKKGDHVVVTGNLSQWKDRTYIKGGTIYKTVKPSSKEDVSSDSELDPF